MKEYHVEMSAKASKQLSKIDKQIQRMIVGWILKNLEGCENPRLWGKSLTGNHQNEWRYRVGGYRMLADIQDERVLILVLEVGHRRQIY